MFYFHRNLDIRINQYVSNSSFWKVESFVVLLMFYFHVVVMWTDIGSVFEKNN